MWISRELPVDFLLTDEQAMNIFSMTAEGKVDGPIHDQKGRYREKLEEIVLCHLASPFPHRVCIQWMDFFEFSEIRILCRSRLSLSR
jgi:hypothetical protein